MKFPDLLFLFACIALEHYNKWINQIASPNEEARLPSAWFGCYHCILQHFFYWTQQDIVDTTDFILLHRTNAIYCFETTLKLRCKYLNLYEGEVTVTLNIIFFINDYNFSIWC